MDDDKQDEDEEDDESENDGKEPRMIGLGEMANVLVDDIDTISDNQLIVVPEQGKEPCKHTSQPQPPISAPQPQTFEPCPQPWTLETNLLRQLEFVGSVTL